MLSAAEVCRTVDRFWSLGGQVHELAGGRLVHHPVASDHESGRFLCRVRARSPRELETLLADSARATGGRRCEQLRVDPDTPPEAEAALALYGWRLERQLQLVLPESVAVPAEPPPRARDFAVRRVADTDADWQHVHALFRLDHAEEDARAGRAAERSEEATASGVGLRRALGREARYYLAEPRVGADGGPFACVAEWAGDKGVGLIEDVFVRADRRGAGVATALLRHAVHRARERGAGPLVIAADVDDTPKRLYARFGFRPVLVRRVYGMST